MTRRGGAGKVWLGPGRSLTLAKLIKSGGAGSVYLLGDSPQQVAKLYHAHLNRALYQRKIDAMLRLSPELPDQVENGKRYVQIAWPQAPLQDASGNFIGFVMPALDIRRTAELEEILLERQARAAGLPTGLGARITLAANLSAVIAALHRQRHYVVDLKPVNLRFYRDSLYIAMLDCDGFSIQGETERFPAQQFTADYLAPEFQARGPETAGEESQDRFALAVVIFQLLNFGIHPFSGKPADGKVPTDLAGRIRAGYYAYGGKPNRRIAPNPTSGHAMMPAALRGMFDQAFSGPGDPRPTAAEWAQALRGYALRHAGGLQACAVDSSHQHFSGFPCAACARASLIASAAASSAKMPKGTARKALGGRRGPRAAPQQQQQGPLPLPTAQYNVGHIFFAAVAVVVSIVIALLLWPDKERESMARPLQVAGESSTGQNVAWRREVREDEIGTGIALATARADVRAVADAARNGRYEDVKLILRRLHEGEGLLGGKSQAEHVSAYADTLAYLAYRNLMQGRSASAATAEIELVIDHYRDRLVKAPRAHYVARELGMYHLVQREPQAASAFFTQAIWGSSLDPDAWHGMAAAAWHTEGEAAALVYYAVALHLASATRASNDRSGLLYQPTLDRALPPGRWRALGAAAVSLAQAIGSAQELQERAASVDAALMERLPVRVGHASRPAQRTTVAVRATLDRLGEPIRLAVTRSSGARALDEAALAAAAGWNYFPALKDGRLSAGAVDLDVAIDP